MASALRQGGCQSSASEEEDSGKGGQGEEGAGGDEKGRGGERPGER